MICTHGTVSVLVGDLAYMYNRQYLLRQKQAIITNFIDFDSGIHYHQTNVVQFLHAGSD